MKSIFASHIELANQVMDLRLQRQNVVSGNLANIGNPEYKARRFEFEEKLQQALGQGGHSSMTTTDPDHMPQVGSVSAEAELGRELEIRVVQGEDGVDLDTEMAVQAKNSLNYSVLALILQKSFNGMAETITKGGQ